MTVTLPAENKVTEKDSLLGNDGCEEPEVTPKKTQQNRGSAVNFNLKVDDEFAVPADHSPRSSIAYFFLSKSFCVKSKNSSNLENVVLYPNLLKFDPCA